VPDNPANGKQRFEDLAADVQEIKHVVNDMRAQQAGMKQWMISHDNVHTVLQWGTGVLMIGMLTLLGMVVSSCAGGV